MHDEERSDPIARGEWFALAGVLAVSILLRLPLLTEPGLHLGWNSDAAIFGLMARAIFAGREFPIFFWGQSYMGPLTAVIAAAAGGLLQLAGVTPAVGPLALRLASAAETLAAIVFYWAALRRLFGARTAAVVALWLAIGPGYVFFFTIAPIGGEQMFLLSAIIFWYSLRTMLRAPRHWLVFGLVAGIGWWIHQGVVFAAGAAIAIVLLRSEAWAAAWPEPQLFDRLLLRIPRLRWPAIEPPLPLLLRGMNALLLLWVIDGALFSLGISLPDLFLWFPLVEPLVAFAAFRIVLALLFDGESRAALDLLGRQWREWSSRLLLFILGALIGYAPVIVGGIRDLYPRTYGLSVPPQPLRGVATHVATAARTDFWAFIGASASPAGVIVGAGIASLLVMAIARHRRRIADLLSLRAGNYGGRGIAAATMLLCALFYVSSSRAHEGSVRYLVSALPMLYAFAARELWTLRARAVALVVALAICLGLAVPRIQQVRAVAAGRGEDYANLGGDFDPRPTLRAIDAGRYPVCYAEYWVAYKLQWVSGERVRFIPFHSFDRTPATSRALAAAPGPKCYVDGKGGVRPFNQAEFDESVMRAARERLRRMNANGSIDHP